LKPLLSVLAAVLCSLCLSGCLELIRRPASVSPDRASYAVPSPADSLPASGNQLLLADVQDSAAAPAAVGPAPSGGGFAQVARIERPKRTRAQQQNIEQVNEYALWCIENSMWNEARSHMERALAQDSLSASLHNNLGIVYEYFGLREKATEFYRRAKVLGPKSGVYQANLQRLEQLQQAVYDSSEKIDIFDIEERFPGTRRQPSQEEENELSIFTGE